MDTKGSSQKTYSFEAAEAAKGRHARMAAMGTGTYQFEGGETMGKSLEFEDGIYLILFMVAMSHIMFGL